MLIPIAALMFFGQGMIRAFIPTKPAKVVTYGKRIDS